MSTAQRMAVWFSVLLGLVFTGCCGLPTRDILGGETRAEPAGSTVAQTCPIEKIAFTQDTGCVNDGSFEFCVPTKNLNAMALVREIVPGVQCGPHRGRVGCDLESEVLCMVNVDRMCVERHGAMTDSGWQTVCDLAALPQIREIVATWYE